MNSKNKETKNIGKQLLNQIKEICSLETENLQFDWSELIEEGEIVSFSGEDYESSSGVLIRDSSDRKVFEGWVDFEVNEQGLSAHWYSLWDYRPESPKQLIKPE